MTSGPLAGIRVIDLTAVVMGPYCTQIMADMGADVVKIEPPEGDITRYVAEGPSPGMNGVFMNVNRGKRSVVLDLRSAEGAAALRALIETADVFIHSMRAKAIAKLGFDYDSVAAINPRIVYTNCYGYSRRGPDADRPAYDVAAFWARAGITHLLTRPGQSPPFQRGGMGDHSAAMTLVAAVCAALVSRASTGAGQLVTTSLYRQGAYTTSFDLNTLLATGHSVAIGQRETMGNPCMNNYATADGRSFWIVGLQGDRHWPPLCRVVGRTEWLTDARFDSARARAANAVELIGALDEIFATRSLDEWAAVFAGEPDFFWSPINSMDDVLADEQFHAAGGIVYVPQGDSTTPMVATPADFHGTPWEPRSGVPALGQHTDEVLAELDG